MSTYQDPFPYPYKDSGPCPNPECGAGAGEPCISKWSATIRGNSRCRVRRLRDQALYCVNAGIGINVHVYHCGTCKCSERLTLDETHGVLASLEANVIPDGL